MKYKVSFKFLVRILPTVIALVGCASTDHLTEASFTYLIPQGLPELKIQPLYGNSEQWTEIPPEGLWVQEGDYFVKGCVLLTDVDQPETRLHIAGGHRYTIGCNSKNGWDAVLGPAPYGDEVVYLVGPLSDVEELPFPTTKEMINGRETELTAVGVALGWFDEVQILEIKGDQVKFARPIVRHPANMGWAPISAFRRDSDFTPLKSWPTPGTYRYCQQDDGCYSLQVHEDASFLLKETPADHAECAVVDTSKPGIPCETVGAIYAAPGYFKLQGKNGFKDFLVDLGQGKICRVGFSNDSFECNASQVSFNP